MKTSTIIVLMAVQFLFFAAIGTGAVLFGYNQIEVSNVRAAAVEARGAAMEKQTAELNALLMKELDANKDRAAQLERLASRNGELEKQIADLKTASKRAAERAPTADAARPATKWVLEGIGPANPQNSQMQEQLLKQLGNIQIRPNGLGIAGSITINGQTLQLGGDHIEGNDTVRKMLDELEEAPAENKPAKKAEKGEQF